MEPVRRSGPLTDVRVIDLTQALAGPFCTMLLADLGADVIKVEPPEGDFTRYGGPFTKGDTERVCGGFFASVNRSKRSIVLDLKSPAGRDTLLDLIEGADVVVENLRPGVLDRLDLSYETMATRNRALVYGAVRGFGDPRTGESPYVDWPAFDIVAQAMSGLAAITGEPGSTGTRVGASVGDIYPATLLALGIVAGVHHARRTGQGQFVDVAMYDALVALCEEAVYHWSYWERVDEPTGSHAATHIPFGIFPTTDGACAVAAPTTHWPLLCEIMGRPDLIDDPRTRTNRDRNGYRDLVIGTISAWTAGHTTAELVAILGGRVPVGPVHTNADLFTDTHLQARDMLVHIDTPGSTRPTVFPNTPIKLTATPGGVSRRPPRLGEHTAEVLAEIGRGAEAPR